MSPAIVGLLAGLALFLLIGAVGVLLALYWRSNQQKQLLQRAAAAQLEAGDGFDGTGHSVLEKFARKGKQIEGWVDTENESARLLVQAGWRSDETRVIWYAFQALLPIGMSALVFVLWLSGFRFVDELHEIMMWVFVAGALSFLVPRWVLRSMAEARRDRIRNEVPLLIHLLVLLFEAGLSSRQAFASLVREGGGVLRELSREFEIVLRQIEAGADTSIILKNLSDAMQVDDLTSVLGALRQVERYGGEVREPLLETLKLLEERRGLDMRERVNLLSGRMTVVMVLFFFPALLIFVAGPAFVSILKALGNING